jgi:glycosyltransferase involved in cell wall biosynthesis
MNIPTLSFCITCMNRFHQISKTLKKNLDDNRLHREWIEFVLVDFGSTDGLREWVLANFQEDLEQGYLRYYYTGKLKHWHASIAKNTAHWLARNDIVMNLDCDNYTGFMGGQFVLNQFIVNPFLILHQFNGDRYDGSFGRIGMFRKVFVQVGGYDESLEPFLYEDTDLINRLKIAGYLYRNNRVAKYINTIRNTKEESFENINTVFSYDEMHEINKERSTENLDRGYLRANNGNFGIREGLIDYKGNPFTMSEPILTNSYGY